MTLKRVAVLNRGEPAVRFMRALQEYNLLRGTSLKAVAFYTGPDAGAPFVQMADEACYLGDAMTPGPDGSLLSSYCHHALVLDALKKMSCDALWPGWGFVSEDPIFVEMLEEAGITFLGPPASAMRKLGDKIASKELAEAAGVPLAPWHKLEAGEATEVTVAAAQEIGFPLMVKASAGGGGRGIRRVTSAAELIPAVSVVADEVKRVFGQGGLFLEQCITGARHIEVQLMVGADGKARALGVRDCSIQRRNQKIIEEAPSPILPAEVEAMLCEASVRLAELAGYRSAGTAEFLYNPGTGQACFLEVNSRLQVEHTVTEMITGADLVHMQLDTARGIPLEEPGASVGGCAIEVRLNAENPEKDFRPSPGLVKRLRMPSGPGVRVDSGVAEGMAVAPEFDSMIAKVIAWAPSRELAVARLIRALTELEVVLEDGATNKAFLLELLRHPAYLDGSAHTSWVDEAARRGDFARPQGEFEALVSAAILAYQVERHGQVQRFFAQAQNGIPQNLPAPGGFQVELRLRGRDVSLEVRSLGDNRYLVGMPGKLHRVSVESLGSHSMSMHLEGRRHHILYAEGRAGISVEVDGAMHQVERASGGVLRAPAPAMVVHVSAQEGSRVEVGDLLCTLEAMKMETPIFAQEAGVVREVLINANQQVVAGQPMILLEPEDREEGEAPQQDDLLPEPAPWGVQRLLEQGAGWVAALPQEELGPLVHELREALSALLLGYDAPEGLADALEQLLELEVPGLDKHLGGLLELLEQFVDGERLFGRDFLEVAEGAPALSAQAALYEFARCHHEGKEAVPPPLLPMLSRALAWYGVRSLDPSEGLRRALWRLATAHAHSEGRDRVCSLLLRLVMALHERGSDWDFQALAADLEQLPSLTGVRAPFVADNARQARYVIFEKTRYLEEEQRLADWVQVRLDHLALGVPEVLAELEHSTQPVLPALLRRPMGPGAAEAALLLQRLYMGRRIEVEEMGQSGSCRWTRFQVHVSGADYAVTLVEVAPDQLADAVEAFAQVRDGRVEVALRGQVANTVRDELDQWSKGVTLGRDVSHVTVSWCDDAGVMRHCTWRHKQGALLENELLRDIHPEVARRLELRRLENFALERLPGTEHIYAFHGRAHENARDERVFVFAEIHHMPNTPSTEGQEDLVSFKQVFYEALSFLRQVQARLTARRRLHWNRLTLYIRPTIHLNAQGVELLARKFTAPTRGLGLEKVVLRVRVFDPHVEAGERDVEYVIRQRSRAHLEVQERAPKQHPVAVVRPYDARVVRARRLGCAYPYEVIRMLEGRLMDRALPEGIEGGSFVEYDLNEHGAFVQVHRPHGENTCGVVTGVVSHRTEKFPEGMERVFIASDPTVAMGALAEPECVRVMEALNLARRRKLPVEWLPISAGAKIAMDSGTENLDWTARVLRALVEFTQAGGEINIIVDGVNVGAQSYWNAEATMLMHTRGVLIMTPRGSMVLTGKKALDFSGGVSAEDERGIGGFERVMGPNGQAQYMARDLSEAYAILFAHYRYTYQQKGEPGPRRRRSRDEDKRSVLLDSYSAEEDFATIGEIFDPEKNPGRKRPFAVREVMRALVDRDGGHLERFGAMRHGEMAVVWDAHLGGQPVCMVGIESRPLPRHGRVPVDGPDMWTGGTLFPQSSRKVARAINGASGNRPVVVLANLSGFDGSPESLRLLQLEYGAEIGRAVVNFDGPMIFVVIGRYHGGAYVVFSKALNQNLQALALRNSYASVIGGAPAAAVVFPREVRSRAQADVRLMNARQELEAAPASQRPQLRERLDRLEAQVLLEKRGEVAREFDAVHTVERAVEVGSLDAVISPDELRPAIIERLRASRAWGELAPEEPATLLRLSSHGTEPIWPSSPSVLARMQGKRPGSIDNSRS